MTLRLYKPLFSVEDDKIPKNFLENYMRNNPSPEFPMFLLTEDPNSAEYFFLPYTWNYYVENRRIDLAQKLIDQSQEHGKKTIIFSSGDYTANGPFRNSVVIQTSAFKSRDGSDGNKLLAMPTFIEDYLQTYFQGNLPNRPWVKKPVVGFCGQSNGTQLDFLRRKANIMSINLRYGLGLMRWEPPRIEPTLFRHRILQKIAGSVDIQTNFIMRTQYRAGYRPRNKDPFHPTRVEFVNNIAESDYTVCMRGGGNFSARFYETLALGRIPIFVNTDCILPFDDVVNYKEFMVWVEQEELPSINQKILDFHQALNQEKFSELQRANRNLWETYLTKKGFYENLAEQLHSFLTL